MGVNQGLGLVLRLDSLEITGACLSSKEERVVLYEINRCTANRKCSENGEVIGWFTVGHRVERVQGKSQRR